MATTYWDYNGTGSTTTRSDWIGSTANWTTTATDTAWSAYRTVRTILVEAPKSWGEAIQAALTKLVNDETDTGWTITMWIRGDIKITDPNIERRSMKDFVPLLKHRASERDRSLIDKFFDKFGAE